MNRQAYGGFVFLDILVGLSIFCFGLLAVLSLNQSAALTQLRAENYLQAVNLASSAMDETLHSLEESGLENVSSGQRKIGKFECAVQLRQEAGNLVPVTVEISWMENGQPKIFRLQSLWANPDSF